ncbi:DNA polymerase III subunit beta [Streptomyces aurantiacus]|uniref:Beta sliding clamp n=1 Tax=Streptomyces aurantiacus JA 4570 TaxID=1286094 RepID=S3ZTX1_9ACTN|nr:DNA polymerase III subunit beta [Streptomyces aurantiacus]EPH46891.1 putative DNA polymerase III subunit beta [Streptomyces aurantiacus JA 4570]
MKLQIEPGPFAAAIADAARALPARPPVPVLAGLKLEAAAGQLAVAAFDYEVSALATLPAAITQDGSALVSGRLLSDITRTVKSTNPVGLELDGTRLVLTCGHTRYTLHTLPLEEYPSLPKPGDTSGTVTGEALFHAVAQVVPAAGRDDTLPVLTGIQLTAADGKLTLAATDRYRFAVRSIDWSATSDTGQGQALISAKALLDAARMLADAEHIDTALPTNQGVFALAGPARSTTTRALEGNLPPYKTFWPTEFEATAVVDSGQLTAAVKRVALVAERGRPVHLHFGQDSLLLTAGSSDDAQAHDRIDADFDTQTGAPFSIAFNPGFLLDGLTALTADTDAQAIKFALANPVQPALLTGATRDGNDLGDGALNYLLMPIRVTT